MVLAVWYTIEPNHQNEGSNLQSLHFLIIYCMTVDIWSWIIVMETTMSPFPSRTYILMGKAGSTLVSKHMSAIILDVSSYRKKQKQNKMGNELARVARYSSHSPAIWTFTFKLIRMK